MEDLAPRRSCCNQVFSHKLWHLQLEQEQNTMIEDDLNAAVLVKETMVSVHLQVKWDVMKRKEVPKKVKEIPTAPLVLI